MKGSLYSVSDKAMFDAINQSKVTNSDLKDIFLKRGILVSPETKREKLATYFSMFPHAYFDYKRLSDILGNSTRREKNTSTKICQRIESATLETCIESLVTDIEHYGGKCTFEKVTNGEGYNVKVEYHEFDYRNSEFKQVTKKEAYLAIENRDGELTIRHPHNKTVDEWKSLLISKIEEELEAEVETQEISLNHISDHEKVTRFFTSLISDLKGYELFDVTDVFVYHPSTDEELADSVEDEEEDESRVELGTHISKAALKGQNVIQSEVLKEFFDKEFYISKVIWRSKSTLTVDSDIYEFEAQFSDAMNREGFSYLAKGFYSYKGEGEYVKNRRALPSVLDKTLNKEIEDSAQRAITRISGS